MTLEDAGQGPDPNQLINTFVAPRKSEPCYIVGTKAGPYVAEHSYNIFTRLGARMALVGIDARVEVSNRIDYQQGAAIDSIQTAYTASNQLPRNI